MFRLFLETWYSLPIGWRRFLTILPLGVSITIAILAWDWPPLVVGGLFSFVLLILPGASEAEKKGYHF